MRLLFWNTSGLSDAALLATLAREHNADLLVIAEPGASLADLLIALNTGQEPPLYFPDPSPGLSDDLQIFYKCDPSFVELREDVGDIAIRSVELPLHPSVLLVAAHLPSKLRYKPDDQLSAATVFAQLIDRAETQVGHQRTVVVGDFNMNPFESGMISAVGLHATMDRRIAMRSKRIVEGKAYRFFYNPMWTLLGDRSENSPGSYYYDSSTYVNYYWNIFDQILLRPELLGRFDPEKDVRILTDISGTKLTRGPVGRPDDNFSDHLPILLTLELQEMTK